jgi:RNA polymerase sigma-B factor
VDPERLLRRYAARREPRDLEALVVRYRPLARSLARRYARLSFPLEDLEQVACVGLVKALHRFDPARGFAFTTFAVPTILGELRRFCRETAWSVHVPRPVQERVRAVRHASDEYSAAHGRAPGVGQLAVAVGCEEAEVREALEAARTLNPVSLDAPAGEDDDERASVTERLGRDEPGYELVDDLASIERALPVLSAREKELVRLRFAEDLTQHEIAARMALPEGRVARMLEGALERLNRHAAPRPHVERAGRPSRSRRPRRPSLVLS